MAWVFLCFKIGKIERCWGKLLAESNNPIVNPFITVQLGCPAIAANRCWGILRMNNSTNKNLNSSREFV
jgi:hypothetical protein